MQIEIPLAYVCGHRLCLAVLEYFRNFAKLIVVYLLPTAIFIIKKHS